MASHAGEQMMKRVSLGVAVLCALSIAAFEGPGDLAFDLSPTRNNTFVPTEIDEIFVHLIPNVTSNYGALASGKVLVS